MSGISEMAAFSDSDIRVRIRGGRFSNQLSRPDNYWNLTEDSVDHFTVVHLIGKPLNWSEAEVDFIMVESFWPNCLSYSM